MEQFAIDLPKEADTQALGAAIAALLTDGDFVCLSGPLGAGKTSLARALIAALTGEDEAPSPSFPLVQTYEAPEWTLRHFDLYRLKSAEEVWDIGFEEALEDGVCLIEWPEKIEPYLPHDLLAVRISVTGQSRAANVTGRGNWATRLASLKEKLRENKTNS